MTEGLPFAHSYNLARLGNAGDEVRLAADPAQRAAIAKWAGLLGVEKWDARVKIKKLASNRFGLNFHLAADVIQSCVVSLEPVPGHLERDFSREFIFVGTSRHRPAETESETVLDIAEEEGPEEIESLHVDLAAPVLEEFTLALDPYPRRPGAEFTPQIEPSDGSESPFAALKALKPGG
jgi:uncharacterized metal-binding protein YceD (DUF177 family)